MTYPRLLPDAAALIADILRVKLGDGVRVRTEVESDLATHLPYVLVDTTDSSEHPEFAGSSMAEISCWTSDSRSECMALAEGIRVSLYRAHREQLIRPAGHISTFALLQPGIQRIPSGLTGVWRATAIYQLGIRPPAAP